MKKWSFLVAALLMASATVTTTSCIDNDEPEGITVLRGAKAELLKAKAALELAKAETEKQQANYVAGLAAVEQARAAKIQAIAKQEEAKAKQEEAKVAAEQAKSEQEKAKAMEALAKAEQAVAQAQLDMEKAKAQFDKKMLELQKEIVENQAALDNAIAEIEAAKAVLTDEQAKKLGGLQAAVYGKDTDAGHVDGTWDVLKQKKQAVLEAEKALIEGGHIQGDEIERLDSIVAAKTADLVAYNAALAVLEELAANTEITEWELQLDSLKAYVGDGTTTGKQGLAAEAIAQLELQKLEIEQSDAYKALEEEDAAAREAYVKAQMEWNYLSNGDGGLKTDCFAATGVHKGQKDYTATPYGNYGTQMNGTHPVEGARAVKKYDFDGAKIAISSQTAFDKIKDYLENKDWEATGGKKPGDPGYDAAKDPKYRETLKNDWQGKRLEIGGSKLADGKGLLYTELKNADNRWEGSGVPEIAKKVYVWEDALNSVKVTEEEINSDECRKNYENNVTEAEKDLAKAVADWQAKHDQYAAKGKDGSMIKVDTKKADDAVKAYNEALKNLKTLVDTYNKEFDAEAKTQETAKLQELKDAKGLAVAKAGLVSDYAKLGYGTAAALEADPAFVAIDNYDTPDSPKSLVAFLKSKEGVMTAADYSTVSADSKNRFKNGWEQWTVGEQKTANETAATAGPNKALDVRGTDGTDGTNPEAKVAKAYAAALAAAKEMNNPATADDKKFQFAELAAGFDAYVTDLNNAGQILKDNPSTTDVAKKLSGAGEKKYIVAGDKKDEPTGTLSATTWFVAEYAWNADLTTPAYEWVKGHVVVPRTEITDISKDLIAEYNDTKAKAAWQEASKVAFGTSADGARHTELTADLVKDGKDENGVELTNYSSSKLFKVVDAKAKLNAHKDLATAQEDLNKIKTGIAEAIKAMGEQIKPYKTAVQEALDAIEPAKTEHQAKHKAAESLTSEISQQIQNIEDTKTELGEIKTKLEAIIEAYYSNTEFAYVEYDPATGLFTEKVQTVKDFSTSAKTKENFTKWVTNEINKYNKRAGKIAEAEFALDKAQKELDRFIELNKTGNTGADDAKYMEILEADLENAKAELEVAQKLYDFSLEQLNAYVAALSK